MASEVLKVAFKAGLTDTEYVLLNGVNGHTYTILSITFCETGAAAETPNLSSKRDTNSERSKTDIFSISSTIFLNFV